ncbi:MAG: hypothetical protein D6724_05735 [Armatimonadetes bacterium]|nr:MAG: hypothetical protein D6724_05735 [Armatimonadota bacterium]
MNLTCVFLLCSLLAGAAATQEQRQPNAYDVYNAIINGRWDEVDRIKEQVGSFSHDKLPGARDVLSLLASVTGYSHVYANALTGVRICIEYGADPNAMQGSPLSIAAGADKWSKVVERLLQYGADPNLHAPKAPSALHNAIEGNLPNNVRLLIEHKADVNREAWVVIDVVGDPKNPEFPLKRPLTPLAYAAWLGRPEITSLLIEGGASVTQRNSVTGRTALHEAAVGRVPPRWSGYPYSEELQTEVVKILLRHGADRKIKDKNGDTALDLAKKAKAANVVRLLEQGKVESQGASAQGKPSGAPQDPQTPKPERSAVTSWTVSQAVRWGKWDEVYRLCNDLGSFKFPIDPQRDAYDVLTLLALETDNAGTYANVLTGVRICIECGADPNAIQGLPLRTAAGTDRWSKVVERLLQHGADPNLHPDGAETALINAVAANLPENVRLLLKYKADPNQEAWVTVKGNLLPFDRPNLARRRPVTPLMLAAQFGRPEIVRILLEGGADVNQADSVYGRTALHEAAVGGSLFRLHPFSKEYTEEAQTETVRILLERGANKDLRDKDGNTALDLAKKANATNVVRLLESSARARAGSVADR